MFFYLILFFLRYIQKYYNYSIIFYILKGFKSQFLTNELTIYFKLFLADFQFNI